MLDQTTDLKSMLTDPSLLEPRAYVNVPASPSTHAPM